MLAQWSALHLGKPLSPAEKLWGEAAALFTRAHTALWWHQHCLCCFLEASGSELSLVQNISVKLHDCNFGSTNRCVLGFKAGSGFPEMSLMLTITPYDWQISAWGNRCVPFELNQSMILLTLVFTSLPLGEEVGFVQFESEHEYVFHSVMSLFLWGALAPQKPETVLQWIFICISW